MNPRVLAIRTDFVHHGPRGGYKCLLEYTKPIKVLGFQDGAGHKVGLKNAYPWLYEFEALKYRREFDLIHLLYAEDYYRFSKVLFPDKPVVATFHQPPAALKMEIQNGSYRGRIGKLTHYLSPNRFEKMDAAIVTSLGQKEVLKQVMSEEKIHHIPLGIDTDPLNQMFRESKVFRSASIITVGNWMRDWDLYFKIVETFPENNFQLICKNIPQAYSESLVKYSNLKYETNVSDDEMYKAYLSSRILFLPVTAIAGSNALFQGMALGCSVLTTNLDRGISSMKGITTFEAGDLEDCVCQLRKMLQIPYSVEFASEINAFVNQFSWERIGNLTLNLYKSLI